MSNWQYNNIEISDNTIIGYYGFVYIIHNLINDRKYIGKKFFTKAGYKTINSKRHKIRLESDWKSYWGSNIELQNDVKLLGTDNFTRTILDNFTRTILYLCKTKSECSYLELREQIDNRVMENSQYYNSYIIVRINKKHLTNLQNRE